MEAEGIEKLIEKYLAGATGPEETAIVEKWYEQVNTNPKQPEPDRIEQYKQETHDFLSVYIRNEIPYAKKYATFYKWMAAAILLFSLTAAFYFYKHQPTPQLANNQSQLKNDVLPGGNKAVLTLANGHRVVLTGAANGFVAKQAGIVIHKTGEGKLSYQISANANSSITELEAYNIMSTPRGGFYHIILEDGTGVWLNSASSLKYPVIFKGRDRVVDLTGEAYFEVAKNKAMPFKVNIAGQTVEVLGTHFNINGYTNEPSVKTTLLEGSVKISAGANTALLKPGEQAAYYPANDKAIKVTANVNIEEVMAWKNGRFIFAEADIQTVMRQLERWYDVDASYNKNIPSDHFNGKISKNVKLSQVLQVLELSGVNFKIEGKKIIIK